MKVETGDIMAMALKGQFDVLVHGCNCFHTMGRGLALSVAKVFPEAYEADKATTWGSKKKLGTISYCKDPILAPGLTVVNAYTQHRFGTNKPHFSLVAMQRCLDAILLRWGDRGLRFGMPILGGTLGGGNPQENLQMIQKKMEDEDVTVVLNTPLGDIRHELKD